MNVNTGGGPSLLHSESLAPPPPVGTAPGPRAPDASSAERSGEAGDAIELYVRRNRDRWSDEDLPLLQLVPVEGDLHGWSPRRTGVFQRPDPHGDPNDLFLYWLRPVPLSLSATMGLFSQGVGEHTPGWTRQFEGAHLVGLWPGPGGGADGCVHVWYQRFDPGVPLIRKRDLLAAYCVRSLETDGRAAYLLSARSVPMELMPGGTRHKGYVAIDWVGAYLLIDDGAGGTTVRKLDRENQGGRFPAWLMNLVMPSYLDAEVRDGSAYIAERREALDAQLAGAAAQVGG